jgi:polar amino acid transport system permease protein
LFDRDVIDPLLEGTRVTLQLTFFAAILGTFMSVASGLASMSPLRPVRSTARVYVEFFRGTSALVQLWWFYYALPLVMPSIFDVPLIGPALDLFLPAIFSPMLAGIIVLGLNMGSYGSEVVRGGIQAVGKGQREASIALSLTPFQRMRYVIFPQAILGMLPPYGNLLIELLKGTALVTTIALVEIVREAQILRNNNVAPSIEIYAAVLVIYFAIALCITGLVRLAERFASRGLDIGRA